MGKGAGKVMGAVVVIAMVAVVAVMQQRAGKGSAGAPGTGNAPGTAAAPRSDASMASSPAREPGRAGAPPSKPAPEIDAAPARADAPASAKPPSPSGTSVPISAQREVAVGSWNIEWLGKPEDRSGFAKNVAQAAADVGDYIIASGVAVLAVQEIVTRERGRPIRSRELEAALGAVREKTGSAWEYVLFPGRADGDQLTGVAWDTTRARAIEASGRPWRQGDEPWMLPIPKARSAQGSALWNRPPHAMKFSFGEGKTDVVFIIVHMKADYNGDFAAHRREEAEALARAMPQVRERFKDADIVIVGDTNCVQDREPAIETFEALGLIDLNAKRAQTHWRGGTMDKAIVPRDQPEFAARAFRVASDDYLRSKRWQAGDFKKHLSDHYLVSTTIRVMADDD